MKLLLIAGFLSLFMGGLSIARADDCEAKLTAQERAVFAGLPPQDQMTLANMKMRDGSPASCEFRAGLLDMLENDQPEDRPKVFHYLLKNTLVKQN